MQKHKLVLERGLRLRSKDQGPNFGPSHLVTQTIRTGADGGGVGVGGSWS